MVEVSTKYLDKTETEGFEGNLVPYKRPDLDSVIWRYRAKLEGMKGYVRRSTKETNFELAKRKDKQELIKNTGKIKTNVEVNITYVRTTIQRYLKHISENKYYLDNSPRFSYV